MDGTARGRPRFEPASERGPDTIAFMVEEGKPAPAFTLTSDAGRSVALSDFRGKPVVLYFYPRDDTPTSNTQ